MCFTVPTKVNLAAKVKFKVFSDSADKPEMIQKQHIIVSRLVFAFECFLPVEGFQSTLGI
jgi:hypothetical protein